MYFKFGVAGDDIDQSFAHCVLCLESGQQKRGTIKSHQLSEILSQWTWSCQQLDLSVVMLIFFKFPFYVYPKKR